MSRIRFLGKILHVPQENAVLKDFVLKMTKTGYCWEVKSSLNLKFDKRGSLIECQKINLAWMNDKFTADSQFYSC